jgi:hypothetical protein
MPNQIYPKDVLWGRQGLGPDYYGPDLIAEALWEVVKAAELNKLRNFVPFLGAFMEQFLRTDWRVSGNSRSYPCEKIELSSKVSEYDLEYVSGVGIFGTRYGVARRDDMSEMPSPHRWLWEQEWALITHACDNRRKSEPDHLPSEQIVSMNNLRVFMSRSRKLIVFACNWRTETPRPDCYLPSTFNVDLIELRHAFDLTKEGIQEFCQEYGANAGLAVLYGFSLQLQSSNYRVRKELEENEKAEVMAKELLARISV